MAFFLHLGCVSLAAADDLPAPSQVLAPGQPYHLQIPKGEAEFMRFSCMGGPADVLITLSSYSERADPFLLLSLDPDTLPSFDSADSSSLSQWKEDGRGHHYALARGVGPRGGWLGLVNMRSYAQEDLDCVVRVHCSYYVVFDTLFWDHLTNGALCPVGDAPPGSTANPVSKEPEPALCSGRGQCNAGVCKCFGDFAGPACEGAKTDMMVAAAGTYNFQVASGTYQYFRIRVPSDFQGGYLKVALKSSVPLILLIRNNDLPSKTQYEMSNFGDWISHKTNSNKFFKVVPTAPGQTGPAGSGGGSTRKLHAVLPQVRSWESDGFLTSSARKLAGAQLPPGLPKFDGPACLTQGFKLCEDSCIRCSSCVKGGPKDQGCTASCESCLSMECADTLSACAGNTTCNGDEAHYCEANCGPCLSCLDSNDPACSGCKPCMSCLPLAAKCTTVQFQPTANERYLYVAVYNHRRYYNDKDSASATVELSLVPDPHWNDPDMPLFDIPETWLGELYDSFQTLPMLASGNQQDYPEKERHLYEVSVGPQTDRRMEVRVWRDRVTLLHFTELQNVNAKTFKVSFLPGLDVGHVMVSSQAAPKTLFDFDQLPDVVNRTVVLDVEGVPSMWVAIFGAADGFLQMEVGGEQVAQQISPLPHPATDSQRDSETARSSFSVGGVVWVVIALLLVVGCIYCGALEKFQELTGIKINIPVVQSIIDARRSQYPRYESTTGLTRALSSLSGYTGSDVIDRSVEDQYLHRGGIGDDGI